MGGASRRAAASSLGDRKLSTTTRPRRVSVSAFAALSASGAKAQAAAGSARDTPFNRRHAALNAAICELVDDFSLVQFGTIDISDRASVARALRSIDKANGYCFGAAETQEDFFSAAAADADFGSDHLADIQERYMDRLRQEHPDG